MKIMYSKPTQGSSSIPFLKIFKVDFENYEPYIPMGGDSSEKDEDKEKKEEKKEETEEEEETEETSEEEKPFDYQLGEILEEYYYGTFTNIDYEFDYEDISSSINISIPNQTNGLRFYKGVQGQFFSGWFNDETVVTMEDIPLVNRLFIEDLTFSEDGTQLSCKGADVLLEEEYQFEFTQMKRSKILEEMIKTAGLEPVVDPTGLIDDVIDYTNVSKSDDDSGSGADSDSTDLNKLVKNAIKGKKGKREKAEAVHNALRDSCIKYKTYNNFNYKTVKECWEHRQNPGLNCGDTSQLTVGAMKIAGLKAETLLTNDSAHFITRIEGQWFSDLVWSEGACSKRPFDATYHNYRSGSPHPGPAG